MPHPGAGQSVNEKLAIIGPGTLGLSLAQWAAECGLDVGLAGRDLGHSKGRLMEAERRWESAIRKGRITNEQHQAARAHLRAHGTWAEAVEGATWVFEALPESLEAKRIAWVRLEPLLSPTVTKLTGTSSISIAEIRRVSALASTLLGFHCFIPMERMGIVELAVESGAKAGPVQSAQQLAARLGKRVAMVRDQPGFAAARMALAQGLEAMRLIQQGVASASDLDALMVRGYGHPVGPLELSDRIGLDLRLAIAEHIFEATGNPIFEPPSILRDKVTDGHLGLKQGCGFYEWDDQGRRR